MAKDKDFELDDEFNFDDFGLDDFDVENVEGTNSSRSPVLETGKAILGGVADTAKDSRFLKGMVRNALPKEYGPAWDGTSGILDETRSLYNDSLTKLKPAVKEIQKAAQPLLPTAKRVLPEKLYEKLKNKLTPEATQEQQKGDQNQSELLQGLAEVFETQNKVDENSEAKAEAREDVKDLKRKRVDDRSFSQARLLTELVGRQVGFQDTILTGALRKLIEINYGQLFMLRDIASVQRDSSVKSLENLANIVKNTGLPEYQKIQTAEAARSLMRDTFFSGILKNIRGKVGESIEGFTDGLSMLNEGADSLRDAEEMGMSKRDLMGGMAGSSLAETLGKSLAGMARKYTDKSPFLKRFGKLSSYGATNAKDILQQWSRSDTDFDSSFLGFNTHGLTENLKDLFQAPTGIESLSVDNDSVRGLSKPAMFDGRTHRTVNDIIPERLGQILQTLKFIATGEETDVGVWSFESSKFVERKQAKQNVMDALLPEYTRRNYKEELERAAKQLVGDGELSKEALELLKRTLFNWSQQGRVLTPASLIDEDTFRGGSSEVREELVAFFKQKYSIGEKKVLELSSDDVDSRNQDIDASRRLNQYMPDINELLKGYANSGQREILREMGLLVNSPTGDLVDSSFLWNHLSGDPKTDGENNERRSQDNLVSGRGRTDLSRAGDAGRTDVGTDQPPAVVEDGGSLSEESQRQVIDEIRLQTQSLTGAIEQYSPQSGLVGIDEKLAKILLKLEEGIVTNGGGNSSELLELLRSHLSPKTWKDRVTSGAKWGSELGGKIGGFATGLYTKPIGAMITGAKKTVSGAWDLWSKRAAAKKDEMVDVYVKGKLEPALEFAKLRAGMYYDLATGKVITKWSEITGPVRDAEGKIVLSTDDVRAGLMNVYGKALNTKWGQKLSTAGGWLAEKGKGLISGYVGMVTAPWKMALNVGKGLWNRGKFPFDVYVRGETEPRLLANVLTAGKYFDAATLKPIESYRDLSGPVLNAEQKVILSQDDFDKGLVDRWGKPITGLAGKAGHLLGGAKDLVLKYGKKLASKAGELGSALLSPITAIPKLMERWTQDTEATLETNELLEEILELLEERIPGKVKGDLTGDGIVDNTVQDLIGRRAAKRKEQEAKRKKKSGDTEERPERSGIGGMLVTALAGLGAKFDGATDWMRKIAEQLAAARAAKAGMDVLGDAADVGGTRGRRTRAPRGKAGLLKRMATGGWRGAKMLGRGALSVGRFALGAGSLMGGGAVSGAGALLSGVGTVLGGIGSVLASPWVLGGLAVAGLGYGAYKAVVAIQNRGGDLTDLRMMQYGIHPDGARTSYVRDLEDELEEFTKLDANGQYQIDKGAPYPKWIEAAGVSLSSNEQLGAWVTWFKNRFKPVYLANKTVIYRLGDIEKISKADRLAKRLKGNAARDIMAGVPGSVYGLTTPPWPEDPALYTEKDVQEKYKYILSEYPIDQNVRTENKTAGKGSGSKSAGTLFGTVSAKIKADSAPAAKTSNLEYVAQDVIDKVKAKNAKAGVFSWVEGENRSLDELASLRMRLYGLTKLDTTIVNAILHIEQDLYASVEWGWFGGAELPTSATDAYQKYAANFGLSPTDATQKGAWEFWYTNRFLPVYLVYISSLRKINRYFTPEQVGTLKPADVYRIAMALSSVTTGYQGKKVSVWMVDATPHLGTPANTDSKSVEALMEALKAKQSNPNVSEKFKTKTDSTGKVIPAPAGNGKPGSFTATGGYQSAYGAAAANAGASTVPGGSVWSQAGGGGGYGGTDMTGGREVNHPGAGTGGDINTLPRSGGDGWEANRDLILAASKMVGVDPALMATMIAIESNFRPGVKAKTSSATGLGQFISSTWKEMLDKYGAKYGIAPGTPPTDARANALMTAEFLKSNASYLEGKIGRKPTDNDLYLAHFLGAGGASTFLRAQPGQIAARIMPKPAAANRSIFYNENGSARTIAEVYKEIDRRVSSRGRTFGTAAAAAAQGQDMKVAEPTTAVPDVAVNDPDFTPAGAGADLDNGVPKTQPTNGFSGGGLPFKPLEMEAPAGSSGTSPATAPIPMARLQPIGMGDPDTAASVAANVKPKAADAVHRYTEQQQIKQSAAEDLQRQTLDNTYRKVQTGQTEVFQSIANSVGSVDQKMSVLIDEVRKLSVVGGSKETVAKTTPKSSKQREIPADSRPLPVKMG